MVANLFKVIWPILACAQVLLVAVPVRATAIDYNDFVGTNVTFSQVTEDSATDPTPLYGAPTVSGNGIFFSPTAAFSASASGNGGLDLTDGKLNTTLNANNPNVDAIHNIFVSERGDYTLAGSGTSATTATVSAPVQDLILTGVNGVSISPVTLAAGNLAFSPSGGNYNLASNPGVGVIWSGSLLIDVDAEMAAKGIVGRATQIQYVMDNTLLAISQTGTVSFIEKKNGFVDVQVNVPEPSTWVLAMIGSLALAWQFRRRRAG